MSGDIIGELREAQAALARVRALADEWAAESERYRAYTERSSIPDVLASVGGTLADIAGDLREALEPRQTRARSNEPEEAE